MNYDQAFLDRLAAQVDTLPEGSPAVIALADYGVEREMLRACR